MKKVRTFTTILALVFGSSLVWASRRKPDGNWPYYGGDQASSHYSRLSQIKKSNVQKLQIAWEWRISEVPVMPDNSPRAPDRSSHPFEATPLMIDDVLYFPDPYFNMIAVNAKNGKQLWKFESHLYEWGVSAVGSFGVSRGVAFWTDGKERRIFLAVRGRLFAIDAATGKLISSFGNGGFVDITETLLWELKNRLDFNNSSPPVVYKNLVIVGSAIPDLVGSYYQSPPGDVQAFDVRTGRHVWSFHPIPQGEEFGSNTWEDGSWNYMGHANAWAPLSLDEKRGLVYLPMSSPANDYYGGERPGNNLFGDSLVCLDANTGKRVWHFQAIHHDLWDYDGVMTPNLLTIHVDGITIDAVAAVSKTGFTYVFDRVTGKPVWPIIERPVPQSDVPGEKTSPTQPFPTKPPPFAQQGFTLDDVVDVTPEIKAMALEKLKNYRYGPIFTPPSIQGTVQTPSDAGGANWGGGSVVPEKGMLYVKTENDIQVSRITRDFAIDKDLNHLIPGPESSHDYVFITPTIADGIPVNKPPYVTLTAIDLNKGEIAWQVPIGDMPEIRDNPLLKGLNIPRTGRLSKGLGGLQGSLVTASGLLFAGVQDRKLYAIDQANGKTLWSADLKNDVVGTPMTYRTSSGRQYVVVATGHGKDSALVAFALPDRSRSLVQPWTVISTIPVQVSAAKSEPPGTNAWSGYLPEDNAKPLVIRVCSSCHDLERVVALRGDASFWSDLVSTMVSYGAEVRKDEVDKLVKYFSTYLGPGNPKPNGVGPESKSGDNTGNQETFNIRPSSWLARGFIDFIELGGRV